MILPRFRAPRERRVQHGDLPCACCGRFHIGLCSFQAQTPSAAPVEHPSANGLYTGPCVVRVLPPGFSYSDECGDPRPMALRSHRQREQAKSRARGRRWAWRKA